MSISSPPPLFVITGVMAAGKSTVADHLAERFARSAHVRGDAFRRAIVNGRVDMSIDPSAEALAQLRLRYRLAVSAAEAYIEAGFVTILQDVIIGPMLAEFLTLIEHRPLALVVLDPSVDTAAAREAQRDKTGYTGFDPGPLVASLREDTARLGLWLDTSDLSVDETVDFIVERWDPEALVR